MTPPRARDYVLLRKFLVQARIGARLTQQDVARKMGKPQSFVAKYETGKRRIDVVEFVKICEALGLKASREILRVSALWLSTDLDLRKRVSRGRRRRGSL
jgi:transcriptional regulator with XRE-family HTH domain